MYVNPRYPMDEETVDRLVIEARGGNTAAFAGRVNSPSDAEDLTQLVFVKALEALPRYESRGIPFGGWLFRLARNAIIDQVRTRREHLPLVTAMARETEERSPEAAAAHRDD